jgi:hypothetical protein
VVSCLKEGRSDGGPMLGRDGGECETMEGMESGLGETAARAGVLQMSRQR